MSLMCVRLSPGEVGKQGVHSSEEMDTEQVKPISRIISDCGEEI